MIPLSRPSIGEEEIAEVVDSLRSGWVTTGPKSRRFEQDLCDYIGCRHALAISSGTAGMHLALTMLGIGPGDEVITSAMTWPSTPNLIELTGATPIFVDVDRETMHMIPEDVEARITERTKLVIPVDIAGQTYDRDAIQAIADHHRLLVIEDAAHTIGAEYKGEKVGRRAAMAVFSLHVVKNMTTAEGGVITTDNDEWAAALRLLRFHGVNKDSWERASGKGPSEYEVVRPGFKCNFTDLQAALGLHQLAKLDAFNERRRHLGERYDRLLKGHPLLTPLGPEAHAQKHNWMLYIVKLSLEKITLTRAEVMQQLKERGVATGLHFTAVHQHRYYRDKYGYPDGHLPNTEFLAERVFSLPLFPDLSDQEQDTVVRETLTLLEEHRR